MPLRGAVVQSENVRQMTRRCIWPVCSSVAGQVGIGQNHPPQADKIHHARPHEGLPHVRQILLQVGITRPNE